MAPYNVDASSWVAPLSVTNIGPNTITATGIGPIDNNIDFQIGEVLITGPLNYRTVLDGNWNDPSIWEIETAPTVWVAASAAPDSATANAITIFNNVAVNTPQNGDQIVIDGSGTLSIFDATFDLNDGIGTDLQCYGSFNIAGSGVFPNTGRLRLNSGNVTFESGSTFTWGENSFIRSGGTIDVLQVLILILVVMLPGK